MTAQSAAGIRRPAGVGTMFASNGAIFAALLPWYPQLADRLGLSAAEFGVTVAAFAVGAIMSSALPVPLIARFGPVPIAIAGTALLALSIAASAWATDAWMLAACILLAGFFDAIVDVGQNVAGIRVQAIAGRSILSSMHALWSLGGVGSGLLSTAATAAGWDMRAYLGVVGAVCVALVASGGALVGRLPVLSDVGREKTVSRRSASRVVFVATLPLVVIAVCGTMVEDVANNWAAMSAVQIGGLSVGSSGLGFVTVIGSQCIGRFSGDGLIQRFGRRAIARVGGILIAVGGALVVATEGQAWQLFVGLALIGYGSATLVPSALSAAARIPGISEGAGVTIVSWLMRLGFLGTSPLIGTIAEAVDLRWGLCVLIVVGVVVILLAGSLGVRRSEDGQRASAQTPGSSTVS